jgi:hypothetical protein
MKFSKKGYLRNSPDVNNSQNIIQGGKITMKGVDFKVHGVDNNGYAKVMTPGYDANFPNAKYVTETPIKNKNMAPFKLRIGKGDMPKTGRSIPSPFQQNADEVSGEPYMVPVTGSSYRISQKALDQAWEQAQTMTAQGLSGTFMGDNAAVKPKFELFKGNKLLNISTGSKAGINVTGLSGEDTATGGYDPYTLDKDAFYDMMRTGTVTIMPTGDGTNMLDRSFQERPETESEERGRLYRKRVERARQQRREKQNGFTQAEDVPVDTTTGVNSTTEPLTREQKLQELKLKRKQRMTISKEKAQKAIAERKRKLEEIKRKRQQR